jgi:hypothetical protein
MYILGEENVHDLVESYNFMGLQEILHLFIGKNSLC